MQVHGDKDDIVPLRHARNMHERLNSVGVKTKLVIIGGADHGVAGAGQARPKESSDDTQFDVIVDAVPWKSPTVWRTWCADDAHDLKQSETGKSPPGNWRQAYRIPAPGLLVIQLLPFGGRIDRVAAVSVGERNRDVERDRSTFACRG